MTGLETLLAPGSIAVIGAAPDPHKIRGALLHVLRKNGFAGRIVPVNPSYTAIDGLPCYPTIAAGGGADLALIAIPAPHVMAALGECAAAGVRYAIIISSGFDEDALAAPGLQDQVAALARRTGMRICGPNAEGFHNEVAHVSATFSPAVDREADDSPTALTARTGIIAQSGGMGFALYNRGRALGLSFSTVVTTGNEADLTVSDFLAHMVADPDTAAVLLFLEGVRDPAAFAAAAASAMRAGKPVVALKVGRSTAGKLAAASHTASMAGWDAAYDAMFRRYGITVTSELEEALITVAALAKFGKAAGGRVAVLTVSGGAGVWAADLLVAAGLAVPELSPATQAAIRAFIPSYGATRNPVDMTAGGIQGGGLLRAIGLLTNDPEVDQVAVVITLSNPARVSIDVAALTALLSASHKPVLFYSYTLAAPLGRQRLAEAGAVICPSMAALAAAARALMERGRLVPGAHTPSPALPDAVLARLAGGAGVLTEYDSKMLLHAYGVPAAPCILVQDQGGLAAAAGSLGFPLALKIQSAAIPHKTEAGGVQLGITTLSGLQQAYADILANAAHYAPSALVTGVLVERMAPPGTEVIVGILRDPDFGPVLMVGAGGIATELLQDTAYRLCPVDEATATAMLHTLRTAPLLTGFRGRPPCDVPALARLIAHVSRLADAGRDAIAEIELNPVIVHPSGQGCTVADALITLAPALCRGTSR